MLILNDIPTRKIIQSISCQDQVELISECLLMAGAIKRHNEDAALLMGDTYALVDTTDMKRVIDGADSLLVDVVNDGPLNAFDLHELTMVWNKLRYMVTSTYQGEYFSSRNYS